jgi:hypothetical protein
LSESKIRYPKYRKGIVKKIKKNHLTLLSLYILFKSSQHGETNIQ